MATKKVTETTEEIVETTPEQELAAARQAAANIIAEAKKTAADEIAKANKIKEDAVLTASNIPHKAAKPFNTELAEADRMTLEDRMKFQFGADARRVSIAIPLDNEDKSPVLSVTVNGIEYPLRRGQVYDVPADLVPVINGSVYNDSDAVAKLKDF